MFFREMAVVIIMHFDEKKKINFDSILFFFQSLDHVFFSVGTAKRVHCYSCDISFDRVQVLSSPDLFNHDKTQFIAPSAGHYVFHFHGLTENGHQSRVQFLVNGEPQAYLFDHDEGNDNKRWSMVSQSVMVPMQSGDKFHVLLHEGALKGGRGSHPFTNLIGYKISNNIDHHNEL